MTLLAAAPEPRWRPAPPAHRLPAPLRDWLLFDGSLTRRLRQHCGGRFSVRLIGQRFHRSRIDEARALGIPPHLACLIRDVELRCAGEPWVLARTLIPASTLCGARRRLKYLGNRPLGALLFADPQLTRGPLEITRLPGAPAVFGRRSLFLLGGRPLLVCEFFLPSLIGACP